MQTQTEDREKGLMTSGGIYRQILYFSIPLLLGNLFQLMYNTIDSVVVGNYVGSTALAAVGASTPVINLLIAFFMGLAVGAGVVVSRYFGARRIPEMSAAIHTFLAFSLWFGIGMSVFGMLMSSLILHWIGVPADVFPQADQYLSIYFAGNVFVTIYNAGTGVLQAVGDSRHPLYFLGVTSLLNVVLDLTFVRVFGWGVPGVAYATIISEAISAVMVIMELCRTKREYRVDLHRLHMDRGILFEIIRIGVPSGLQGMIVSFSNVIVQAYVNDFGAAAIAGFSSANKYDNFLGLPVNSFALACTTFTGQNLGARKFDRVEKGVRAANVMSIGTVLIAGLAVFLNAASCIGFFSQDPGVIQAGVTMIRIMCPFYLFLSLHQNYSGALRASGRSAVPMVTSVMAFVVIRQIYLAAVMPKVHDISVIGWGYSGTWILAAAFTSSYYFASRWLQKEEAGEYNQ